MRIVIFSIILIIVLFGTVISQQNESNTAQNQNQAAVIDLTDRTYSISARMELPQVKIIDKRIPPKFKDVAAEKSFANELSTESEQISFEPITSGKVKPIRNVESLLKKKRF